MSEKCKYCQPELPITKHMIYVLEDIPTKNKTSLFIVYDDFYGLYSLWLNDDEAVINYCPMCGRDLRV